MDSVVNIGTPLEPQDPRLRRDREHVDVRGRLLSFDSVGQRR